MEFRPPSRRTGLFRAGLLIGAAFVTGLAAVPVSGMLERQYGLHIGIHSALAEDAAVIRLGFIALRHHLQYIGWLAETRKWLAGGAISLADFAAAAHLSALDFAGDVDWTISPPAREWYARMKSRPSFRAILSDRVPGTIPSAHYADLDF